MNAQVPVRRMSPLTAMFLGLAAVFIAGIGAITVVGLYGLSIVDNKSSAIVHLAGETVENLPELVQQIAPAVSELLGDREPDYGKSLTVQAAFVPESRHNTLRPTLTITNNGSELVTWLGVRVVALNAQGQAVADWTDVVATPVAIDDMPGPIGPGSTRQIIIRRWGDLKAEDVGKYTASVEVTEIRVWRPGSGVRPANDVAVAAVGATTNP